MYIKIEITIMRVFVEKKIVKVQEKKNGIKKAEKK